MNNAASVFFVPIVPAAASCPAKLPPHPLEARVGGGRRPDNDCSGSARGLGIIGDGDPDRWVGFPGALPAHSSATADGNLLHHPRSIWIRVRCEEAIFVVGNQSACLNGR